MIMTNETNPTNVSNGREDIIEELIERERTPHREPRVRITGLMVQYYHVCKRELWVINSALEEPASVSIRYVAGRPVCGGHGKHC